MSSPDDLYLTAGQVAEFLHVSTKTVHRWAEQGLLRCTYTLGGHRRFRLSDVESAVATIGERRENPPHEPPVEGRADKNGNDEGGSSGDPADGDGTAAP